MQIDSKLLDKIEDELEMDDKQAGTFFGVSPGELGSWRVSEEVPEEIYNYFLRLSETLEDLDEHMSSEARLNWLSTLHDELGGQDIRETLWDEQNVSKVSQFIARTQFDGRKRD